MRDDMPKELRERIPHDVRLYVGNFWRHPNDVNRPYDFYNDTGDEYFYYLTDDAGPLNPKEWGDIVVLLFARGCLKTTTCNMIMNWASDCYNNIEGVVTAPRRDQTQEVMDRFIRAAEESGMEHGENGTDKKRHQAFEKKFKGEDGVVRTTYADVKARSAWGEGDALRGIHAHYGVVDEFQDVDEGMFSVFKETVDRKIPGVPYFPVIFVIGTPKMANSFFHQLWEMSDKCEWDDDAKEWYSTQDAEVYMPPEAQERKAELEGKRDMLLEMDEPPMGEIEVIEDELDNLGGFRVTGWHIDQYACPRHSPADIAFKKATYSKRKFRNEVEALFYTPENDLLADTHLREAFVDENFHARPEYDESIIGMGVDWGGGDGEGASTTSVVVGELNPMDDTIKTLKFEWFDHDLTARQEQKRIEDYMIEYDVDFVVVDEGYGAKTRSNLQEGLGTQKEGGWDNIYGCHYGNVNNTEGVTWSRKGNRDYFTVNRTYMIESMVEDVKRGKIIIPSKDLDFGTRNSIGTRFLREMTAPYTDRVETPDGKKKLKVIYDTHADMFHAFTYMWIGLNHLRSKRQVKSIGAHDKFGY